MQPVRVRVAWAEFRNKSDSLALFGVRTNSLDSEFGSAVEVGVLSGSSIDTCPKDRERQGSQPRYAIRLDYIHVSYWDITKPTGPSSTGFNFGRRLYFCST